MSGQISHFQTLQMEGKTVLITGATDGIGQHTAIQLAKMGASVLVHGRFGTYAPAFSAYIGDGCVRIFFVSWCVKI